MQEWPHQIRGTQAVLAAIQAGQRRICLTSPTGGGKTLMLLKLARHFLALGEGVILFTNRKMLLDQTSDVFVRAGLDHGIRAADHDADPGCRFQLASIQTELSRTVKRRSQELHPARLVLLDEAHLHTGDGIQKIVKQYLDAGAVIVGSTATPIGLGDYYDHLVVAGTTSELRGCGALVLAHHFGPDEPDMRAFKKLREGEDLTESQQRKAMMTPSLWGRVWTWFERLNPEHRPTILFAPGVQESLWFAQQFHAKGISAAHIDGESVWWKGEFWPTSRELREEVLDGSKTGNIAVLCNRFVLREGIDCPWLAHAILATVFGSLQSYLQSGGRILRSHHSLDQVTIQDHGGNWHRHGSLNADREWSLEYTASMIYGLRADKMREKKLKEPWRCPECGRILTVARCPCGYESRGGKRSRPVVSTDGSLKELTGDIFKPHRISHAPNGPKLWEQMYYRSRTTKGDRTFRAAMGLFAFENHFQWPSPDWPFMPIDPLDNYRKVIDVPREKLTR